MSTPLSAKFAKVRVGAYVFTAKTWRVNPTIDALDVTNFEGAGYADWIGGIVGAEFTIEADWDSVASPFVNPPNIIVSAVPFFLSAVKLYTNDLTSSFWSFPSALVTETPMTAVVRETLAISVTARAKGTFSYPA